MAHAAGPATTARANTYLYVGMAYIPPDGSPSVGSVDQFRVEGNGTLTALNPPALASVLPNFLAVDPTNQYLFVPSEDTGTPSEFGIGNNGSLTPTPAPAAAGSMVAFTPSGEFVIIPSPFDNTLTSYNLDAAGVLSAINTVATGNFPEVAVVDGSGKFAYVANSNDGTISEYTISRTGMLAPIGTISPAGNLFPLVVSPTGFLYCGIQNLGSVAEFAIDPFTGALTRVGTYVTSQRPQGGPIWISFDPNGRNAYVGNSGGIAQFRVNRATGALISNGTMTYSNAEYLWGAVDPTGRFLFGAGGEAGPDGMGSYGMIGWFVINGNGTLTPGGSLVFGLNTVGTGLTFAQR